MEVEHESALLKYDGPPGVQQLVILSAHDTPWAREETCCCLGPIPRGFTGLERGLGLDQFLKLILMCIRGSFYFDRVLRTL